MAKCARSRRAAAWRKPESALTDYDYSLRSQTYFMSFTPDDNARSRKLAEEGLARFPNSRAAQDQTGLDLSCTETDIFRAIRELPRNAEIAYKLGREAEEAKNKSRFLIFQSRKLMSQPMLGTARILIVQSGSRGRGRDVAHMTLSCRAGLAFYVAKLASWTKAIELGFVGGGARFYKNHFELKINLAWALLPRRPHMKRRFKLIKGGEASTHGDGSWSSMPALGRIDEARAAAAEWLKNRAPIRSCTESCCADPRADEAEISRRPAQGSACPNTAERREPLDRRNAPHGIT